MLLDSIEDAAGRPREGGAASAAAQAAALFKEEDIFSLQGPEWAPSASTGAVRLLEAAQGALFVATAKGQLLRLSTAGGDYEELELPRTSGTTLQAVFVDPHTAHALILSTSGGDNFYVFRSKCRPLSKMKGVQIASVAWLPPRADPSRPDAREVLIGTMSGTLHEAVIEPTRTRHFKQCHAVTPPRPILGLQAELFPPAAAAAAGGGGGGGGGPAGAEERRLYVMATTPSRYYEFVGGPGLEALFSEQRHAFKEVAPAAPAAAAVAGEAARSCCLTFYRRPNRVASAFGWLTPAGVCHGSLLFGAQSAGDSVVHEYAVVPYPAHEGAHEAAAGGAAADEGAPGGAPAAGRGAALALALSEFHVLLLYASGVLALSRLNHQVACRVAMPRGWPSASLGGLAHDGAKGTLWVWGGRGVLRLLVRHEDRHVWRLHLEAGDYEAALSYCSDLSQRDRVLTAQADHEFERGAFELAALKYAKTRRSFEAVALRFLRAEQRAALQTFLLHKLDAIDERDTPQLTMICTWLCEMYLHAIDAARGAGAEGEAAVAREFRTFLTDRQKHLNRGTTYALIAAHGQAEQLLHFAALCADWERVLSHHVQRRDAAAALDVLAALVRAEPGGGGGGGGGGGADEGSAMEVERLLEAFSPELITMAAERTVDVWVGADFVDPLKLLPALMRYDEAAPPAAGAHQGLRYLHHCVGELGCQQTVLHNYLVLLHARLSDDATLLGCLRGTLDAEPAGGGGAVVSGGGGGGAVFGGGSPGPGTDLSSLRSTQLSELAPLAPAYETFYDPHYALRVCAERGRHAACVLLYQQLQLHEEAVALALRVGNLQLAKQSADVPRHEPELRKRLWVQVARRAIEQAQLAPGGADQRESVRGVVALLRECELLRIDDLLPHFPDFAKIDDFKEQICASLEDYNRQIDELKAEMSDATASADALRRDIKKLRERSLHVRDGRVCDSPELAPTFAPTCGGGALAGHSFVAFPCGHAFRLKCLEHALAPHERQRLSRPGPGALEEALAAECPLCGEAMVESVCKPFVDLEAEAALAASWAI